MYIFLRASNAAGGNFKKKKRKKKKEEEAGNEARPWASLKEGEQHY